MNPQALKIMIGVLGAFLAAVSVDLQAFIKARSKAFDAGTAAPPYDWGLAGARWLNGAIVGLITGIGISAVS